MENIDGNIAEQQITLVLSLSGLQETIVKSMVPRLLNLRVHNFLPHKSYVPLHCLSHHCTEDAPEPATRLKVSTPPFISAFLRPMLEAVVNLQ